MKRFGYTIAALLALCLVGFAGGRSAYPAVPAAGGPTPESAILSTGPGTYDRFVRSQAECGRDEVEIPTWSASGAFLGRTCGPNPGGG